MYTAADVGRVFETIAPRELGLPTDQYGVIFGDPNTQLTGLTCAWSADCHSIAAAAAQKCNMIVCHEALWAPRQTSPWYDAPDDNSIKVNTLRRELLERHNMVIYRSHSNWDGLPVDGVPDQAVATLGFQGLKVLAAQKFFKVHELPEAMSVRDLGRRVRERMAFNGVRVFGDMSKSIRRFCFLIGGFGENQHHTPQVAQEMGADVLIIGEMSEFIVIYALELGIPVIETLHSVSESPAIVRQSQLLSQRLAGLNVRYIPSGALGFIDGPTNVVP